MSTRNEMLKLLEQHRGEYVSGAEIASLLGVSGTAIWKAVRMLRRDGYEIKAVTNRGYMLSADADVLSEEGIRSCLAGSADDLRIEVFDSVGSTNTVCIDKAGAGESEGYIAVAATQSKGKGRRGRAFYSPGGSGIYLSILLRPEGVSAKQALRFTTMAAVAVANSIEAVSGKEAGIKWVNDIYVNGRKVCGILTEGSFDIETGNLDYAVVGIGVNVVAPDDGFPAESAGIAGAVYDPDESKCSRNQLAAEIIRRFFELYRKSLTPEEESAAEPGYMKDYRRMCFVTGREIDVIKPRGVKLRAQALGLDSECRLLVRYEDGSTEMLDSGEISIRV